MLDPLTSEQLAVFHLLQLSEQGRPHEIAAQFLASWMMSSEPSLDEISGFHADIVIIRNRMEYLCLNPQDIWEGLLPGGPGKGEMFVTVEAEEWARLQALEQKPDPVDPFAYTVSIMCDPRVRFEVGQQKLLYGPVTITTESPLNLAREILHWMESANRSRQIPISEQVAWITHNESQAHWIMEADQAEAIFVLEELRNRLNVIDYDTDFLDEELQGIGDQMAIMGQEYAVEQGPQHDSQVRSNE